MNGDSNETIQALFKRIDELKDRLHTQEIQAAVLSEKLRDLQDETNISKNELINLRKDIHTLINNFTGMCSEIEWLKDLKKNTTKVIFTIASSLIVQWILIVFTTFKK